MWKRIYKRIDNNLLNNKILWDVWTDSETKDIFGIKKNRKEDKKRERKKGI